MRGEKVKQTGRFANVRMHPSLVFQPQTTQHFPSHKMSWKVEDVKEIFQNVLFTNVVKDFTICF